LRVIAIPAAVSVAAITAVAPKDPENVASVAEYDHERRHGDYRDTPGMRRVFLHVSTPME
jgi:hypothetical protein